MTRMLWKDFFVEIRRTLPRYLSILFIVALGVAFFSGVRSSEPDMRLSADTYYDGQNFMDIRILSTLGLTDDDLDAIRAVDGVSEAEGLYSVDAFLDTEEASLVASVQSLTGDVNRYYLTEGRLPETTDECLLDAAFLMHGHYTVGERITLRSGTADPLTDSLVSEEYTIVGFGYSPMYLSWNRSSASIGTGKVTGFVALTPDAFLTDVYTQIFVTADSADALTCMTDSYDNVIDPIQKSIESIADARLEVRYHEVTDGPYEELADAKQQVADGWQEIEDARQELADALATLEDGEDQMADAYEQIADARAEITVNEKSLAAAEKSLAEGQADYEAGEAEYEENAAKLADAQEQLTEARITCAIAQNQIDSYKSDLNSARELLERYSDRYETAKPVVSGYYDPSDSLTRMEILDGYARRFLDHALGGGDGTDDSTLNDVITLVSWSSYLTELKESGQITEATYNQLSAMTVEEVTGIMLSYYVVTVYEAALDTISSLEEAIAEGEKELESARGQIAEAEAQVRDGKAQLEAGSRELVKASVTISIAEQQLNDGRAQLADAKKQLADAETELEERKQELADGWAEYYKQKAEADIQIADAEADLQKAEAEIAENERKLDLLKDPQWYVLDRNMVQAYAEYSSDAERIGAVGEVFPAIFFLVAALVSLTSMTRMVEEQRTLIGTMKALGYSKGSIAAKYILYALSASLIGSIIGVLAGEFILPQVILTAYGLMYLNLPVKLTPVNWYFGILSTFIAVSCTTVATLGACFKALMAGPAALMRPAAPKQGKRVVLERVSFFWNRLSFTSKATVRNLFRYKKRFFMTVFGIGGCMALLMVGFGLRDSIQSIISRQYRTVWVYDVFATIDDNATDEERDLLIDDIAAIDGTKNTLLVRNLTMDVEAGSVSKSAYLFVPETTESLDEFVILKSRTSGEHYELEDDGVIITEKLSTLLDVSVGDTMTLLDGDTARYTVTVKAIVENYLYNYVYMTSTLYRQLYGTDPVYNTVYINQTEDSATSEDELSSLLMDMDPVSAVTLISEQNETISDMMHALDLVVWVLIISAGLLAYIVLYNLNSINITERRRELATLKVLGFYPMEVANYVYRENVILTICGILFGILFGFFLHRFVILTVEVEMMMFGRTIQPLSYVFSILITFLFAAFVNGIMYFSLKKIDMVESLKSVE